jgi:glycosyltransferase involved in cell wall biosynthesis
VAISSQFKPNRKPKLPIVVLHTRNQSDVTKITKSFYLQYPIYKWLTFKDLRGLPKAQFADELSKACLSIWVDDQAGFGTFPLESIECDTPVIAKIPNTTPEWMEEVDENGTVSLKYNGIWTSSTNNIPELISTYMKLWLEDSVPQDLLDGMGETKGEYSEEKQADKIKEVYGSLVGERIDEFKNIIGSVVESNK